MRVFVGVTDDDWFHFLAGRPDVTDVNFWRPSGLAFRALGEGELFLFKLHAPNDVIVGGGFFTRSLSLPLRLAWDTFGAGNGAATFDAVARRMAKYRRGPYDPHANPVVTCIILSEPFFFPREQWVPVPESFKRNIVTGKGYRTDEAEGHALYAAVVERLQIGTVPLAERPATTQMITGDRFGAPRVVTPRLGQGAFRALVTEAHGRRCSVTGEKTLPVLEAAHVQAYAAGGPHAVDNGLLLRSDLHRLFDLGYVTVDPDERRLLVSRRIREEFENGRQYYALEGQSLRDPLPGFTPVSAERLHHHAEQVYRG